MASFTRELEAAQTGFTAITPSRPVQSRGGETMDKAIVDAIGLGVKTFGQHKARKAGERIAGEGESFESAEKAVLAGGESLESRLAAANNAQEGTISLGRTQDFRKEVFDKVLINKKRIAEAIRTGQISSSEGNARMMALRGEALSNPFIAGFQGELDDVLFETTGGQATAAFFGATASEQEAAADREGELKAVQEQGEARQALISSGMASSDSQANKIILNEQKRNQVKREMEFRKEKMIYDSDDSRVMGQLAITEYNKEGFVTVQKWIAEGGTAEGQTALLGQLDAQHRIAMQELRTSQKDIEGNIIMDSATFENLEADINSTFEGFKELAADQSKAKGLGRAITEIQARLDKDNLTLEADMLRLYPIIAKIQFANKMGGQIFVDHFIRVMSGSNKLLADFDAKRSPAMAALSKMAKSEKTAVIVETLKDVVESDPKDVKPITNELLGASVGKDYAFAAQLVGIDREAGLAKLANMRFKMNDLFNNPSWKSGMGADPEIGNAAIRGAVAKSVGEEFSAGIARGETGWVKPKRIELSPKVSGGGSTIIPFVSIPLKQTWSIDTFGAPVSDSYKESMVYAMRLGLKNEALWKGEFDTVEDWMNDLFTSKEDTTGMVTNPAEERKAAKVKERRDRKLARDVRARVKTTEFRPAKSEEDQVRAAIGSMRALGQIDQAEADELLRKANLSGGQ